MRSRDPRKEAAIRQQALAIIVKHGFDGLTMHKVARAADVSTATLYAYFKDRDDLILKLYDEVSNKMFAASLEGFDAGMPFDQGLRIQWINRAHYFLQNPLEMHFMEQIRFSPLHERAFDRTGEHFRQIMGEFIAKAAERHEVVAAPLEVFWSIAFAPLYQLVKFHMHGKGLRPTETFTLDERTVRLTLEMVLKALKP